ncbi:MAG: LegC family aminotransferase [Candidatus Woesearchaeota archaeon]
MILAQKNSQILSNFMFTEITNFIKTLYKNKNPIPLHEPIFLSNEINYIKECIETTFVSYVGKFVSDFEDITSKYVGSKYAVAVVNGTAALQIALQIAGVKYGDEVLTQPLTFVATANAISHCGAKPVFIDVDIDTMGMSPEKLNEWLNSNTKYDKISKRYLNKSTNKPISSIVPMHTFGFPCRIDEIIEIANKYDIPVVEDSAESLGSFYKNKHTGTFGLAGIFSYNGNKTITTGGGGMIVTDNEALASRLKHLTTTAKTPHKWEYIHDEVGYNYRMPNINAALGVAQMERFDTILKNKRETAEFYKKFFDELNSEVSFFTEPENSKSNYWLNAILFNNIEERNKFLEYSNSNGVMTRPVWRLMHKLPMYNDCFRVDLGNSEWIEERVVNIPSGYRR